MADLHFLDGGGEMGALMRAHDWSTSPLGDPAAWPQSLRSIVALMINSRYPMFVAWGPDLAFLYNDGYAPIFGAKHPNMLGVPFKQAWSEIWDDISPLVDSALAGNATYHENLHLVMERNGYPEDTWYDFSYSPVRDESGAVAGMFCACTEKTEAVLAGRALVEREAHLRTIFEQLSEGVIMADVGGKLTFVNSSAEQFHGVSDLGATPNDYSERYHLLTEDGDHYPSEMLPLARAVLQGKTVDDERWRIRRPDGSEILAIGSARPIVDDGGTQIGSVLTMRDDTRRSEIETKLRESEERYRTLFNSIDEGFCIIEFVDGPHGPLSDYVHVEANPAYTSQAGIPDVVGQYVRQMVPDEAEGWIELYRNVLITGEPIRFERELEATGRVLELFAARLEPESRRQVMVLFRDMTARAKAELALRRLNESLEQRVTEEVERRSAAEDALRQSQKMEAIGQLTGGIAHDFNNLLQIIAGNLDILKRNLPEELPRLRRSADNALKGAERAAVLTQRLLAFSRRQPLAPKVIDPNKLVSGMSEMLHRTLGETYAIETVTASGLWRVEADPNQLEGALLNLAINARDAMPDGGKLTIETANTHIDRDYSERHSGVAPGQYVVICVSDSGTGMDPATVQRAIEPFFTTKDVGKGTGLGLSMVYGFVKQSGGHLKIYSERGSGTTVKIYLPRHHGAEEQDSAPLAERSLEGAEEETILLCEDDDDVRAFSAESLEDLGYRVIQAADGEAALSLLKTTGDRVDLLFTDVVLPGITGAVLAERARALRPGLKVLFTTGYARNAIVHHGRLDAGVELLSKPFTQADLSARIRDLLDAD